MFLNYSFENSKGKIKCDVCEKEHLKGLIFNFNMDKNANLRHLLLVEKYGGIVEFKPLCIGCECEMKEPFKIEITHKEISGLFIKARDAK